MQPPHSCPESMSVSARCASAAVDIPKKDEPMYSRNSPNTLHVLTTSSDFEFSNRSVEQYSMHMIVISLYVCAKLWLADYAVQARYGNLLEGRAYTQPSSSGNARPLPF